ncbi:hypothetical protein BDR07DRAFT_1375918 [Suillus spraguei]|nr:hypothetical protein BDR07DRAFT_1385677 [Suillus spraguei]KAG2363296.1 hypothetical protein BDR07DRAFT_1375918 [Suillus spraguei]
MAATPVGLLSAMATEPLLQSLIITKQVTVHNPVATISCGAAQHSRSPSPTDEDLLNKAIANLVDFDMDGEQAKTPVDNNKTNRSNTSKFEQVLGKRPCGASGSNDKSNGHQGTRKRTRCMGINCCCLACTGYAGPLRG